MIPGFTYLIYIGKILDTLDKNKDLIIVLDSPSSGHALTMLEATSNFSELFKTGLIFEDTKRMLDFIHNPQIAKINIISVASELAMVEANELREDLREICPIETEIILNDTLYNIKGLEIEELPEFMRVKSENQLKVARDNQDDIETTITHSLKNEAKDIVLDIEPFMGQLA
jgi:anion-transporting  ArsA/GET3 family ATPase